MSFEAPGWAPESTLLLAPCLKLDVPLQSIDQRTVDIWVVGHGGVFQLLTIVHVSTANC